jgi:hypothetical protein
MQDLLSPLKVVLLVSKVIVEKSGLEALAEQISLI